MNQYLNFDEIKILINFNQNIIIMVILHMKSSDIKSWFGTKKKNVFFWEKTELFICSSPNERVRPHQLPPVNEFHYKHYTPEEFEAMGKQAGFTDVDFYCQTSGKHYEVRPGLEGGKFMIAVFSKEGYGYPKNKTKGGVLANQETMMS